MSDLLLHAKRAMFGTKLKLRGMVTPVAAAACTSPLAKGRSRPSTPKPDGSASGEADTAIEVRAPPPPPPRLAHR